jgi:hypothetical protein
VLFLDTTQGSETSVYAATAPHLSHPPTDNGGRYKGGVHAPYFAPYYTMDFPALEAVGPFAGSVLTAPALLVRCSFSDRLLHSRMLLDHMPACWLEVTSHSGLPLSYRCNHDCVETLKVRTPSIGLSLYKLSLELTGTPDVLGSLIAAE